MRTLIALALLLWTSPAWAGERVITLMDESAPATGTRTAVAARGCKGGSLQVSGDVTTYSLDVEGSNDAECLESGASCVYAKFTTHTSAGISDYDHTAQFLRVKVTVTTP